MHMVIQKQNIHTKEQGVLQKENQALKDTNDGLIGTIAHHIHPCQKRMIMILSYKDKRRVYENYFSIKVMWND